MKLSHPHASAFPTFALAAISSFAPIGAARQIVDSRIEQPSDAEVLVLLDDLNPLERRHQAVRRLHATPVARWISPLRDRLRRAAYEDDDALRAAYEVLTYGARDEWSDGEAAASDAVLVELLIFGTRAKYAGARRDCAQMLGRAPKDAHREVVDALRLVLKDESLYAVAEAAQSLGNIGAVARVVLPELGALLANPTPSTRQALENARNQHLAQGGSEELRLEHHLRSAAAFARLQIGGPGIDLDEYAKLDDTGRAAAAAALVGIYQSAFYPLYDSRLPMPEGIDRESLFELQRRVTVLLVDMFKEPHVSASTRNKMLHAVGAQVSLKALDPQVRIKATEIVDLAARSDDEKLRSLAERIKAEKAKRSR